MRGSHVGGLEKYRFSKRVLSSREGRSQTGPQVADHLLLTLAGLALLVACVGSTKDTGTTCEKPDKGGWG